MFDIYSFVKSVEERNPNCEQATELLTFITLIVSYSTCRNYP